MNEAMTEPTEALKALANQCAAEIESPGGVGVHDLKAQKAIADKILTALQSATAAAQKYPEIIRRETELENQLAAAQKRIEEVWQQREEEYAIVDRCWKALGFPPKTYRDAIGKSIDELITELKSQLLAEQNAGKANKDRLDTLEAMAFMNRESEMELHFDYRGTLREAIDALEKKV